MRRDLGCNKAAKMGDGNMEVECRCKELSFCAWPATVMAPEAVKYPGGPGQVSQVDWRIFIRVFFLV